MVKAQASRSVIDWIAFSSSCSYRADLKHRIGAGQRETGGKGVCAKDVQLALLTRGFVGQRQNESIRRDEEGGAFT